MIIFRDRKDIEIALNHLIRSRLMIIFRDRKGIEIARYEHPSEAKSFVRASYPWIPETDIDTETTGNVKIKDANGEPIAEMSVTEPLN